MPVTCVLCKCLKKLSSASGTNPSILRVERKLRVKSASTQDTGDFFFLVDKYGMSSLRRGEAKSHRRRKHVPLFKVKLTELGDDNKPTPLKDLFKK